MKNNRKILINFKDKFKNDLKNNVLFDGPKSSANDLIIKQNSNDAAKISAESMLYGTQKIGSFHQDANRGETREHETPRMAIGISSEKPYIDNKTYSKLSGRY